EVDTCRLGMIDFFPVAAPAVVLLALVGIREDGIGLADFFEEFFGVLVARIDVGVVLAGKFSVGGFDVLFGRGARDAEHLVIVAAGFCGGHASLASIDLLCQ